MQKVLSNKFLKIKMYMTGQKHQNTFIKINKKR